MATKHFCPGCGEIIPVDPSCSCHHCNENRKVRTESEEVMGVARWVALAVMVIALSCASGCWTIHHFQTERDKAIIESGRFELAPDHDFNGLKNGFKPIPKSSSEPKK